MLLRAKRSQTPESPVEYPSGTFVKTEKGYFYVVSPTKRYRLISERVLASWHPHRVVKTSEKAMAKYRIAAKMKFRNGSLIWNISDGKLYLIENGLRRWITSPDALERIGAVRDEAVTVSKDELNLHEQGKDLN